MDSSGVEVTRRTAVARLVNAVLALLGGALAAVLGIFSVNPGRGSHPTRWIRAAVLDDLEPDVPHQAVVSVPRPQGWYTARARRVVYLVWNGGDTADAVQAISSTCTHLGCGVRWDGAVEQFRCPCHGGVYDASGRVVAGPPPRALDRLPVRIETSGDARHVMVRV